MRGLMSVGAVLLTCMALASTAAAASWTAQLPPAPRTPNGQLAATACASSASCEAVGSYINSAGWEVPSAEHWNGSGWTAQTVAKWPGATSSQLDAVSCTSAVACMAIGEYNADSVPYQAGSFSESWNGTSWTGHPVAVPAGFDSPALTAVSCTSVNACTAVGYGLVERWNGQSWTVQSVPAPAGSNNWTLTGVSCRAASACTAVGYYFSQQHNSNVAFAEVWSGQGGWRLQTLSLPAGAQYSDLQAVSCTSSTACTAVGNYDTSTSTTKFFAERLSGTTWRQQMMPTPTAGQPLIKSVSCSTASSCTAVGTDQNDSGKQLPVAEAWNGTSWVSQTPVTPTNGGFLNGVFCTAANACTAVGGNGRPQRTIVMPFDSVRSARAALPPRARRPAARSALSSVDMHASSASASTVADGTYAAGGMVQRWNGSSWTQQTAVAHAGATPSNLDGGVSCSAANACTAVGTYENPATGAWLNLAERWNGTSWSHQTVPSYPGETDSYLISISCSAPDSCMALGTYDQNQYVSFSASWNGASWTLHKLPTPTGAMYVSVYGVSCTAANACTAVGSYYLSQQGRLPLAARWNGSGWSLQTVPRPVGSTDFELTGVSCTATGCIALGGGGVAERWNGSSWTIQQTLTEPVFEISCTAVTACMAVGQTGGTSSADRLTGTTWKPQTVPASLFALAVSCGTASSCTAVGADTGAAWNGSTWSSQTLGQPQPTGAGGLRGVSCTGAVCMATGVLDRSIPVPISQRRS